jgi:hypothetical protein
MPKPRTNRKKKKKKKKTEKQSQSVPQLKQHNAKASGWNCGDGNDATQTHDHDDYYGSVSEQ